MRRFFTSDLHFSHLNVIDYCDRPYKNIEEMDAAIIAQWNSQVSEEDVVYVLGDFSINRNLVYNSFLVNKLNGRKILILGNHDDNFKEFHKGIVSPEIVKKYYNAGWSDVYTGLALKLKNGREVILSHLPPDNSIDQRYAQFKNKNDEGCFYLHGHLHGRYRKKDNMIDVCFDADLKLWSEDEIISLMNDERTFIPTRLTERYQTVNKLEDYEVEVKRGYVTKNIKGNLVLFNYTDKCTYDREWNDTTRKCRGIIFDKNSGELVALPFPKFFNLGEMPETKLENLPNQPYEIYEKMDGSLGIIYHYGDKWNVATRGSMSSEQAVRAEEILKKYDLSNCNKDLTLLVEIIYPENKIVVNYGSDEKLVLLAAYHRVKMVEFSRSKLEETSKITGMPIVEQHNLTIPEMLELQKTLPKDREGFVVRYSNGLRLKIKGNEYFRIHKLISQVSPLAFWESMENGKVRIDFLKELPEEYRKEADAIVKKLEEKYMKIKLDSRFEFWDFMKRWKAMHPEITTEPNLIRKIIGIHAKQHEYGHLYFSYLDLDSQRLDKGIMKMLRPTGNVLT